MRYLLLLTLALTTLHAQNPTCPCVFLPPADRCSTQWGISPFVEFLYWQAKENGLNYALKNKNVPFPNIDVIVVNPHFSFKPAFRLGVVFKVPHDFWNLTLDYTYYKTHSHNTSHSPILPSNQGLIPFWVQNILPSDFIDSRYAEGKSLWRLHFNVVEGFLSRSLCLSKALSFTPSFGLKNSWITQRYNIHYQGVNDTTSLLTITTTLKNKNVGIGPLVGFDTRWNFLKSWDLFLNLSASLLYTRFSLAYNEIDTLAPSLTNAVYETQKFWTLKPNATLASGFHWGWCRCRNSGPTYAGLGLAYEAQFWWKQNQFFYFPSSTSRIAVNLQDDLFIQGITADFRIDF